MNKTISLLAITSTLVVGSMGSAHAGVLTPPPPNADSSFSNIAGTLLNPAGVNVYFRSDTVSPTNPLGTVAIFDFFPEDNYPVGIPTGPSTLGKTIGTLGTSGKISVDNITPFNASNPFASALGTQGRVADFVLPYLGVRQSGGLPLNFDLTTSFLTPLLDYNLTDDGGLLSPLGSVDTFTATNLNDILFAPLGTTGTTASFIIDGFWNIQVGSEIKQFNGTVTLGQTLVRTPGEIFTDGSTLNGVSLTVQGSADVHAAVPEPSALVGLVVVAGAGTLLNRKRKSK